MYSSCPQSKKALAISKGFALSNAWRSRDLPLSWFGILSFVLAPISINIRIAFLASFSSASLLDRFAYFGAQRHSSANEVLPWCLLERWFGLWPLLMSIFIVLTFKVRAARCKAPSLTSTFAAIRAFTQSSAPISEACANGVRYRSSFTSNSMFEFIKLWTTVERFAAIERCINDSGWLWSAA